MEDARSHVHEGQFLKTINEINEYRNGAAFSYCRIVQYIPSRLRCGQEHGRTIPLPDMKRRRPPRERLFYRVTTMLFVALPPSYWYFDRPCARAGILWGKACCAVPVAVRRGKCRRQLRQCPAHDKGESARRGRARPEPCPEQVSGARIAQPPRRRSVPPPD